LDSLLLLQEFHLERVPGRLARLVRAQSFDADSEADETQDDGQKSKDRRNEEGDVFHERATGRSSASWRAVNNEAGLTFLKFFRTYGSGFPRDALNSEYHSSRVNSMESARVASRMRSGFI